MRKRIFITVILIGCLISINTGKVHAILQANQTTHTNAKTDTPTNWITTIRTIETKTNLLGFKEIQDETTLKPTTESNNIDIHMMKTTEYGAIAILSSSRYGNLSNSQTITTTTGNETGIMIDTSRWDVTAGGTTSGNIFSGISSRYYDTYEDNQDSARAGDALGTISTKNPGCTNWHLAPNFTWVASTSPYFVRGNSGIFSYADTGESNYYARGVAIISDDI